MKMNDIEPGVRPCRPLGSANVSSSHFILQLQIWTICCQSSFQDNFSVKQILMKSAEDTDERNVKLIGTSAAKRKYLL